LAPLGYVHEVM